MEPPTNFRFPARDGQPLHPLSPERVNSRPASTATSRSKTATDSDAATASPHSSPMRKANLFADYHPNTSSTPSKNASAFGQGGLPQSPSLPEFTALRSHVRTNSDVQGLVKRFEHLDVRDRDGEVNGLRRRLEKAEMELQRSTMGREEAESESKRLREQLKDSGVREVKVSKRLEKIMADYTQAKEQYSKNAEVYEKEIRKQRKEAFKSASHVLKLQETLNSHQKRLEVSKLNHAHEVAKAQKCEEEARDAMCALSIMRDEYEKLKQHLDVVEQEKEALKLRMDEAQVTLAAAEGGIALPASQDDDEDLFSSPRKASSPKKRSPSPLSDDKENVGVVTKKMLEAKHLQDEIDFERQKREAAEDMVDFLRMECAFKCCDCATAAKHGRAVRISMDEIVASSIERMKKDMASILSPPMSEHGDVEMEVIETRDFIAEPANAGADAAEQLEHELQAEEPMQDAPAVEEEDQSITLAAEEDSSPQVPKQETIQAPRPTPAQTAPLEQPAEEPELQGTTLQSSSSSTSIPVRDPSPPSTPTYSAIRTITTTTRIPMHFTPLVKPHNLSDTENIPPLDSECAIDDSTPSTSQKELPFDREAALAAIAYRRGRAKSLANGHLTPRKQMLEGVNVKERRDISAPVLGGKNKIGSVSRGIGRGVGI